jgi:hypothetical protein
MLTSKLDAAHWDEVVSALGYDYLRRHDLRHAGLTQMRVCQCTCFGRSLAMAR